MFKNGVIDPAKVTRSALQNAASIASILLTTEVLVAEVPEKKSNAPMPNPAWIWIINSMILNHPGRGRGGLI